MLRGYNGWVEEKGVTVEAIESKTRRAFPEEVRVGCDA